MSTTDPVVLESLSHVRKMTREQYVHSYRVCRAFSNCRRHKNLHKSIMDVADRIGATGIGINYMVREARRDARLTERQERITFLTGRHSGPVYYRYSSTDCDLIHVEYAMRFGNQMEAAEYIQSAYDGAEGPTHFSPLTEQEYREASQERVFRDYAAEQMNY